MSVRLPIAVISVINDVKNDVALVHDKMTELMKRVAETRQTDLMGVHDLFDEIQQKLAFRLADYYASGNMDAAKSTTYTTVQFPDAK